MLGTVAEDTKKSSESNDTIYVVAAAALVVAAVLIPAILAAGAFMAARHRIARREFVVILVASIAALVLGGGALIGDYFSWLGALAFGGDRLAIPFLSLLVFTAALTSIAGLIQGTSLAAPIVDKIAHRKKDPFEQESILPTEREKAKAKVVTPPGQSLTIAPQRHSIIGEGEHGKRAFPIGIDRRGVPVEISEDEIRMHGMLFGSTGAGKSKTIEAMAGGLLDLGWSGMVLDLKEDTKPGGLRDWCKDYSTHHALPYQELRLSDPAPEFWFNPLAGMGPDEARDTILSLNEFEAAYWENINKKMLGQIINLVYWAHQADPIACPYPTMYELGKMLGAPSLPNGTKKMRALVKAMDLPGITDDDFITLHTPSKDEQMSASGFGAKLTQMYDTQAGRTVLRPSGDRRLLDVTQPGISYIGLDSQGKADLTRIISSAMLQRMSVYAAQRTTGAAAVKPSQPRFLIIDEANWVDRTIIQNLLSRARSAGIAVILCTQSPLDFDTGQRDAAGFASLAQNTNVVVVMSQGEPEAAEVCADFIGKQEVTSMNHQVREGEIMDMGSTRKDLVHLVPPDALRSLEIGEAIIRIGKPHVKVTWMSVKMRDPKAGPHR